MTSPLYSRDGAIPAPLPDILIDPDDGYPRTGEAREAVAAALGYVSAPPMPEHDQTTQHPPEWTGAEWVVRERTEEDIEAARLAALASTKATAVTRINDEAGGARGRYVTVIAGQEGTYLEKAKEAAAYAADPDPEAAAYPYLAAEARHTGQAIAAVAARVEATARAWTLLNAEIEGLRRGALVAVEAAGTDAAVLAVFPIAWP